MWAQAHTQHADGRDAVLGWAEGGAAAVARLGKGAGRWEAVGHKQTGGTHIQRTDREVANLKLGILPTHPASPSTPHPRLNIPQTAPGDDELRVYRKIMSRSLVLPDHISPLARDLIDRLLQRDPEQRLGAGPLGMRALKAHPWFQAINWDALLEHRYA